VSQVPVFEEVFPLWANANGSVEVYEDGASSFRAVNAALTQYQFSNN